MNQPERSSVLPDQPPRVAPLPLAALRPGWQQTLERIPGSGLKGRYFPANVLGGLMQSPDVFGPFIEYWVTCKERFALSVREQELVILRMAWHYRSNYVWKHHIPVAREFSVQEAEWTALRTPGAPEAFAPRERALLTLTDEMMQHRCVRDTTWNACKAMLTTREVVDLIHLVSQYVLFALTNNVLQVAIEPALDELPGLDG